MGKIILIYFCSPFCKVLFSFVAKAKNFKRFTLLLLSRSVKFSIGYKKFHLNFAICPVWPSLSIFVSRSQFFSNLSSVSWLLLSTQIAATRQSHVKLTLFFSISFFVPFIFNLFSIFGEDSKKNRENEILSFWRKFYHYSSKFRQTFCFWQK